MKAFPMFINTTGRRVVIVGGGEQAAQKCRLILKTDAQIVLSAPDLDDELSALVASGRALHHTGPFSADLFAGAAMVFVATGCFGLDICAHSLAKAAGAYVNVVDQPELCDLTTPALVDRDPVVIAIGTEGTAPVLARQIKTKLEEDLPVSLGGLAALAGRLRAAVAEGVPRADRRAFWTWAFAGKPYQLWSRGAEAHAAQALKAAIAAGAAPGGRSEGALAIVAVGTGARDLLTLRAVQRLQDADVIFHDADVPIDLLELARRDAHRVALARGDLPAARGAARVLSEARQGARVVWLTREEHLPSELHRAAHRIAVSIEVLGFVPAGGRMTP